MCVYIYCIIIMNLKNIPDKFLFPRLFIRLFQYWYNYYQIFTFEMIRYLFEYEFFCF